MSSGLGKGMPSCHHGQRMQKHGRTGEVWPCPVGGRATLEGPMEGWGAGPSADELGEGH